MKKVLIKGTWQGICFAMFLLLFAQTGYSQQPALDASFGNGGLVTCNKQGHVVDLSFIFPNADKSIFTYSPVFQVAPNGAYYYKGTAPINVSPAGTHSGVSTLVNFETALWPQGFFDDFTLMAGSHADTLVVGKMDTSGIFDNSFGNGGVAKSKDPRFSNLYPGTGTKQSDGKYVFLVSSSVGYDAMGVLRCLPNGYIDSSFATHGINVAHYDNPYSPTTPPSYNNHAVNLLLQPDDKILLLGDDNYYNFLIRYKASGQLDSTFGTNGIRYINLGNGYNFATRLLRRPNGKLVLLGASSFWNLVVAQLNPDGSFDSSFGTNGIYTTQPTKNADGLRAREMALLPDGKILVAADGQYTDGTHVPGLALLRLNADGTPDTSFGPKGVFQFRTTPRSKDRLVDRPLIVQDDGKVVLGYNYVDSATGKEELFALVRFRTDGLSSVPAVEKPTGIVNWQVEPNPTTGTLYLKNLPAGGCNYLLSDAIGRTLRRGALTQPSEMLYLEDLPAGLYLLQLREMGGAVKTFKVIKE